MCLYEHAQWCEYTGEPRNWARRIHQRDQKNTIKREEKVISLSGIYELLLGIELYSYLAWRSDTVPESPTSSQKRTRSAAERDPRHDGI